MGFYCSKNFFLLVSPMSTFNVRTQSEQFKREQAETCGGRALDP